MILNFVENIANTNFNIVLSALQLIFVIFWIFVLVWVWVDAGERTTNVFSKLASVVLVGVLNIVGLLIYLIIRPKQTLQDLYWIDLERRYLKYETSELGDCPNCKMSMQPGFNLCPRCGYQIKQKCNSCLVWIDKKYNYCPFCGQKVGKEALTETNLTPEEINSEVVKSKEEAISTVTGDKTKYVERGGLVTSVKKDFFTFAKKIGDMVLVRTPKKDLKDSKKEVKKKVKKSRNKKNKK